MDRVKNFYTYIAFASLGIIALPVGIANLFFGYVWGDSPCHLCWGQRLMMILIGLAALFIVRFGLKLRYLGMILLFAASGMWQSFYHFGLHATKDVGQGFGLSVFGLHTQFWAEIVFWSVPIVLAIIFFISKVSLSELKEELKENSHRSLQGMQKTAFTVFFVIVASNAFQALFTSGPPPYESLGDPVRTNLSWNEWKVQNFKFFSNQSLYGNKDVSRPDLITSPQSSIKFSNDWEKSPLNITKNLHITSKKELSLDLRSPIRNIKYEKAKNRYLISGEKQGFYIANEQLDKIQKQMVLDRYYAATVWEFVGVSVLDGKYRGMGSNKSFSDFKEDDNITKEEKYYSRAHFTQGYDKFARAGYGRGRLLTRRAQNYFVGGADNDEKYTYLATQPNNHHKELIIIKQLNADKQLSAEFKPTTSEMLGLKKGRTLGELYTMALVYDDDKLYLLSKNYNTIVVIDLKSEQIIGAFSIPKKIKNARSMTLKNGTWQIISYEEGKNILYDLK